MKPTDVVLAGWFLDAAIVCWFLINIVGLAISIRQVRDSRRRMLGVHSLGEHPAVLLIAKTDYEESRLTVGIFVFFLSYGVMIVARLFVIAGHGNPAANMLLAAGAVFGLIGSALLLLVKRYRRLRSDRRVDVLLKRQPFERERKP